MANTATVRIKKSVNEVFKSKDVQWGPIGKEVYLRTYSRLKPDGTQETWDDTVLRVVEGNLAFVPDAFHEPEEKEKLLLLLYSMEVIPGGRHLWATGVSGRQYVSNCHSSGWSRKDLTEHFVFSFEELMKGGGVGSNYSNKYIEMYPPVFSDVKLHMVCNPSHPNAEEFSALLSKEFSHSARDRFVVEDSREGWSNALAEVLRAAWYGRETPLIVDVSMLREKGAILRSFGGKSSGPSPLVGMLCRVAGILNGKVGKKMSSLDMMEIDHEVSKVVVAGGIRRSARMSIKSWADKDILEFLHCKRDPELHWTTNISVEVDDGFFRAIRKKDAHALKVLSEVVTGMKRDGEPGFWNSSLSAIGEIEPPFTTNPCLTYETPIVMKHGIVPIGKWAEQGSRFQVWDGRKWVSARAVATGEKPVVKLTLSNKAVLRLTADHRIGTLDGGEVTAGESLGASLDFMVPIHEDIGPIDPKMVIVGFVQGNGNFHKASNRWEYVYLGEKDVDVLSIFKQSGVKIEPEGNRSDKYIIDKSAADLFEEWLMPVPLKERHLTERVRQLVLGPLRSFLMGLYSANGSVLEKYRRVMLKSVSQDLVSEVQTLLTVFGIRSYVTVNEEHEVRFSNGTYVCRESYDLNITSEDARRFRECIGFIQAYKNDTLDRMLETVKPGRRLPVTVTSVEDDGIEPVFDFKMDETHWASVNGFRVHNCGEVPFGQWDVCNLGHVNLERFADDDDGAREAFRLMTRFLMRATFGDIMNPNQKSVVSRNRRIGVGFFGYHHWVVYQGFRFSESHHIPSIREKLQSFHDVCRKEAREYGFKLRIPEPIKVTSVAPTGSISLMPGVTSGCQPIFARYYLRRVRFSNTDSNLKELAEKGYPIELSVNEPNTKIVNFFCKDPLVASCEARGVDTGLVEEQSEISLSDHLAVQSMIQKEFADNAISYTINFDPKKISVEEIVEILKVHLPHLKGTTLMPEGDSRPQMPFQRITQAEFEDAEKRGIGKVSDKEMECLNGVCPIK